MAKCNTCRKRGFFLRTSSGGRCGECEVEYLESLGSKVSSLEASISRESQNYEEISASFRALQTGCLELVEQKEQIQQEYRREIEAELRSTRNEIELSNAFLQLYGGSRIRKRFDSEQSLDEWIFQAQLPADAGRAAHQTIEGYFETVIPIKVKCYEAQELRKAFRNNRKAIEAHLTKYKSRYTTKANRSLYQLMVIGLEAELQNILATMKYGKLEEAIEKIEMLCGRYVLIASTGSKTVEGTILDFLKGIRALYTTSVQIEYEYYVKHEKKKEEQREIRERMKLEREEMKVLKEQQAKMEAEEAKYRAEMEGIERQLEDSNDQELVRSLQERLDRLQAQFDEIEEKRQEVLRLQNGVAGHIYVISNLGSFGPDVFKVGMTRRLDPQDRINELGDASVPFRFDVHSMIFSENARDLEARLHERLDEQRVNKINQRKEFFRTSLDELEKLVFEIEPTAEFTRTMAAEQYHQSLSDSKLSNLSPEHSEEKWTKVDNDRNWASIGSPTVA